MITLGYSLGGETTAKLYQFAAMNITSGILYGIEKRFFSDSVGISAALIYLSTPIIAWESTTAYIDLMMGMYSIASIAFLAAWFEKRNISSIVGAGICLGAALGIKPTGAYLAVAIGLVVAGELLLKKEYRNLAFRSIVIFAITTILVGGVWYLRTYLITGNPVFPFLNEILKAHSGGRSMNGSICIDLGLAPLLLLL